MKNGKTEKKLHPNLWRIGIKKFKLNIHPFTAVQGMTSCRKASA
jgi:hypothetical protein